MTTLRVTEMVGALDPTLKSSPILDEQDEDFDVLSQEVEDQPACYFNNVSYADGVYVCSGSTTLLYCDKGIWLIKGGCDPDNP